MKLENFVLGPAWQALPFDIQVGLAHIWLAEQPPLAELSDGSPQGTT